MTPSKIRLLGTALILIPAVLTTAPVGAQPPQRGAADHQRDGDGDRGSWRNRDRRPQEDNAARDNRWRNNGDRGDRRRDGAGAEPPRRDPAVLSPRGDGLRGGPEGGPRRPDRDLRPGRGPDRRPSTDSPPVRRDFDSGRRDGVHDRRWDRRDQSDMVYDRRRDGVQDRPAGPRRDRDGRWDGDRRDQGWDGDRRRDPRWDGRGRRDGRDSGWDGNRRDDRDDRWDHDRRDYRWDNRHDRRRWEYAQRRRDFYRDRARRQAQLRWIHHMNSGWSTPRYYGHWGPSNSWRYHRTYYTHGYDRRQFAYYDGICRYERNGDGAVVGALLGALIGGAAANDDDVGAGILIGAGFGAVLGSSLSSFDSCDRAQYHYAMNYAFEYGQPYYWTNPYSGVRGTVVVRETYYIQGVECRWGDAEIYMPDGTYNYDRVRMCRDAYGDWQVARNQ